MKKFVFILLLQFVCVSLFAQGLNSSQKLKLAMNGKNQVEVLKIYANAGKSRSQYFLGLCYEYGEHIDQSYVTAFYWYSKAAAQGNADAQAKLGEYYRDGKGGVEQDFNESYYWYKKAAENGNDVAQYYVGEYYEQGTGVAQDNNEAFNWYLKAAKKNTDAQYKVGVCYDEGIGVAQNSSKAIKYWKKAAKDGNYFAQKALDEHKKK